MSDAGEKEKPPPVAPAAPAEGATGQVSPGRFDEAKVTAHDPARCATCTAHPAFQSYNELRRDEVERESWARGRTRICDRAERWCA